MNDNAAADRLSRISTLWTEVRQASAGAGAASAAQRELWDRYGPAVRRYLLGALGDEDAADEVLQDFALRFLSGCLRGADPTKGRFRDFVKGALFHLIADYHRRKKRQRHEHLPEGGPGVAAAGVEPDDPEGKFVESWRAELLQRAWQKLEVSKQAGQPFYDVLRFRAEQPGMRSGPMAEQLSARLGRPVTGDWVRQTLHRARARFADVLIEEVLSTLAEPTLEELERELTDVGLLSYCQPALTRYKC
jgi:RNA polymerase sigma-70 factor (ECF subfamily)